MKPYIVIIDCNHGFFDPEIEEARRLDAQLEICPDPTNLNNALIGADIIIVQRYPVTASFLDRLSCKVVARYGVGLDNVDCEHAKNLDMSVVNFPGFCTEEVANHTLAAILYCQRSFDKMLSRKNQLLEEWGNLRVIEHVAAAGDSRIGIVGLGRIGSSVCSRLQACGFEVWGVDPYVSKETWNELQIKSVDINTLFESCSVITLHTPLTPETEGMVSKDLLNLMPMGSALVNTSRGEVVVTKDLVNACCHNVRVAFLDVCDPEPPPKHLYRIPNIHFTHHCAFYSQRSLNTLKRGVITDSVEAYYAM